jgi:hypothetical protein
MRPRNVADRSDASPMAAVIPMLDERTCDSAAALAGEVPTTAAAAIATAHVVRALFAMTVPSSPREAGTDDENWQQVKWPRKLPKVGG